jgi:membrane protease YdiL (CAAX protease family)
LDQAPPAHPVPPENGDPDAQQAPATELSAGGEPSSLDLSPHGELTSADAPGRTRPRFEELPPGPPRWPGWVVAALGFIVAIGGLVQVTFVTVQQPGASLALGAWITILGLAATAGGLGWLALAAIIRRRVLPPDRYRGPSIFVLLAFVIVLGNLGVPVIFLAGGDLNHLAGPGVAAVLILLTPASFLIAVGVFSIVPRALVGVRLTDGAATGRRLGIGVLIGLVAAFAADLLLIGVSFLIKLLTGSEPNGEQAVVNLARDLPPVIAILALVVVAPLAEELFFRVLVLNAWEREYGTTRAVIGSSLLFAFIHLLGGSWLALVAIVPLGFLLGLIYARWRSLPLNLGVHAGFNLLAAIALIANR